MIWVSKTRKSGLEDELERGQGRRAHPVVTWVCSRRLLDRLTETDEARLAEEIREWADTIEGAVRIADAPPTAGADRRRHPTG